VGNTEKREIELSPLGPNGDGSGPASERPFDPAYFDTIRLRRIVAYVIDVVCIALVTVVATFVAGLLGILSFGALTPVLIFILSCIPLAYNTLFVGGTWQATPGMRFMDLRVETLDGGAPDYLIAFLQAALFYFSVTVTSWLILLVSLFNPRGRCLHDFLSGVVVRRIYPAS